jgi:hypothetical protein
MLPQICDDANPPCCRSLWDIAEALRAVVFDAVKSCCTGGECDELTSFISVGEPVYALGDYVAVWIDGVAPAYRPPSERESNLTLPRPVARLGVQLMESGWPNVEGGPNGTIPTPEAISAAAFYSYGHAEMMIRTVYRYLMRDLHCSSFEIEAAGPNSQELYAGWRMFVQISWDM